MAVLILFLGFTIGCLSGFLGIGGGIILAPALLFLPPLLGVGNLGMHEVSGLTITQSLFACLSGAILHDKYHCVNWRLVVWMGTTIVFSALAGAILSRWIPHEILMVIFAGLALFAAGLMLLPRKEVALITEPGSIPINLPLAVLIALVVGLLGGMVGQGGSFVLIPLMLYVLKIPTRVVIGSNLALVFLASLAGFVGKVATDQVPMIPAALLVVAAVPGTYVGAKFSHRTSPSWLRTTLAVVVGVSAILITLDVLSVLRQLI
jgi:uncharacterized membrane protein YfcA